MKPNCCALRLCFSLINQVYTGFQNLKNTIGYFQLLIKSTMTECGSHTVDESRISLLCRPSFTIITMVSSPEAGQMKT